MKFAFDGCGSRLRVELFDKNHIPDVEQKCRQAVENFEKKYSRFIHGNFLHTLNTVKQAPASRELVSLISLAKKVSEISEWHFDITVLPFLENRGYGIEKNKLSENFGSEYIEIRDEEIFLHNDVSIDLWSLGKWYLVDYLYKIIEKYSDDFIIDFWGDIRVKWSQKIMLEDGKNIWKHIGEIILQDMSIAASSSAKRQFWKYNHLINPKDLAAKQEVRTVYVLHKKALFADIFATAIHVSPLHIWEKILRETPGVSWYIQTHEGKKIISTDFNARFYDTN